MAEAKQHNGKSSRKDLIVYGVIAGLVVLAFGIPFFMLDGTERYSGEEKRAAEAQLKGYPRLQLFDTFFKFEFTLKDRVESVYRTPDSKAESWCRSVYKEGETYYSVEMSRRTFFGIEASRGVRHDACILM